MNDPELEILFEDNHLIAVSKKPGQISQGDHTGDTPLGDMVKSYLKDRYNKPGKVYLGVLHRLDRPASGVQLFARTSKAAERLSQAIQSRSIQKKYLIIVSTPPNPLEGKLSNHLVKNEKLNKSFISSADKQGAKMAELHYRTIGHTDRYTLVEIDLITGRHHQIRTQFACIGCPIKGDLKYGDKRSNPDGSIYLHAYQLRFEHPVLKEEICITAPPPKGVVWDAAMKLM